MLLPASQGSALLVALLSTVCWGSWSNFLVLAGNRIRFELFYLNYSLAAFVTALLAAVTLGMVRTGAYPKGEVVFLDDFRNVPVSRYFCAMGAGAVFNVANLLLCKGVSMLGLALAFPLCIGTAMVLGTVLTYVINPSGNATLLFSGVAVAFCAVCLAAVMHWLKEEQQKQRTSSLMVDSTEAAQEACTDTETISSGSAVSAQGPTMQRKLLVCILGGILMSCWNPLVALAEEAPGLSPFGEFVFFTAAVQLTSLILVPLIIAFPIEGGKGMTLGEVLSEYPKTLLGIHFYAFLGGFVWALGTLANAIAGASGKLSSAESYAIGQCANVAAIFWGAFFFGEFEDTNSTVKALLVTVVCAYIIAIALIANSAA
jgi:glucose uptake protein